MEKDPQTIIAALESTAQRCGALPALSWKADARWHTLDWNGYRDAVMLAARGLLSLGLQPGDGVAILSGNRPEWFMSDLAAIAAGGLPAGLYTTATAEQCGYVARHCGATVAVVENSDFLPQLADVRAELAAIVVIEGDPEDEDTLSWAELLERGRDIEDARLRERIDALDADRVCTLIYTSGTTGPPKGVMLSHRNFLWMANLMAEEFGADSDFRGLSYLPLSHVAEQVALLYTSLVSGCCISFAESLDLLADNLQEVRPTYFFAVPRVWEKIQSRMQAAGAASSGLRRRLVAWAREVGLKGGYSEQRGESKSLAYAMANRLVFSKVRKRLGLERADLLFTGAAAISKDTLEFFLSLGMPILEVYGMTESTGGGTFSMPDRYRTGSAGYALPGSEIKIADDGEIWIRGPQICLGYYRDEEQTSATIDAKRWLHTGDIGTMDEDGFLWVVDRKKELLVTSGGKNVAPVPMEVKLGGIPGVAQAVVVGERRNYLSALLVLDPEQIPELAEKIGSRAQSVAEAASCEHFRGYLEEQVARVNETLARYETIKRFAVLDDQLSVEAGTLTPTLKIKRRGIAERYGRHIEALYTSD
jgi:long-subunit acyl-CoA synthetase (AMP-forming)